MNKNKKNIVNNTEFAKEIRPEVRNFYPVAGQVTRNLVKVAEQQLAVETGNDPTPDKNSKNK